MVLWFFRVVVVFGSVIGIVEILYILIEWINDCNIFLFDYFMRYVGSILCFDLGFYFIDVFRCENFIFKWILFYERVGFGRLGVGFGYGGEEDIEWMIFWGML